MERTKSQQINKNKTKAIRIDAGIHQLAKVGAAKAGRSLRSLTEEGLVLVLDSLKERNDEG
ncbi:MAG: hypothetical protein A2172_00205 [Candidatus Woykebacteria bacterium RBG_13_40_15]|uniref:Uncharacterized protein n=1 Tax=Candidatus Woykebacteria bacterium RBG_13_40_15 TaxID=1802593 RepID=A0A1G1W9B1_9BACT|nr:MAG: hypothetical protein A2172_00205 [Candidatus Woykebacteria bacterium RBG_13_40_15]